MDENIDSIVKKYLDANFIYGYADLKGLLKDEYKSYNCGISIGRKLDDLVVDGILSGPTLSYYDNYKAANAYLYRIVLDIQKDLTQIGIKSFVMPPTLTADVTETEEYKKHLKVDVSHKMVATRAGLGWIGRTDLFVSYKYGPRLRLNSILIDTESLPVAVPVVENNCGSCSLCVEYCPAQAATGDGWNVNMKREDFFDAFKCRDKCKELSDGLEKDVLICGICVSVCPVGERNYINK